MTEVRKGDGSIIRPELTQRPWRMQSLPIVRGYPVPWFVDWVNGVPEFRAMDHDKLFLAAGDKLCWVCGEKLGRNMSFVSGPMCGVSRVSAEPPCHKDCAVWSAINCPFLNNPDFERRETAMQGNLKRIPAAGIMILRNPGVTLIWTTRDYQPIRVREDDGPNAKAGLLFQFGEPISVEWYCRGRSALRAEVEASIESGLPKLLDSARNEHDRGMIHGMRKGFDKYLPTV